jgi:hypothetical protein
MHRRLASPFMGRSAGGGYDDLLPPYEPIFMLAPKTILRRFETPVTTAPRPPG